jgi:MFS family permease
MNVQLGLKQNWRQFALLVLINAFVGGMVGLERSILPEIAEVDFAVGAKTAILSFIIVFGITKAITNYYAGALANKVGRKKLLTIGWLFALPIPFILIFAKSWNWVVFGNLLLGINQRGISYGMDSVRVRIEALSILFRHRILISRIGRKLVADKRHYTPCHSRNEKKQYS